MKESLLVKYPLNINVNAVIKHNEYSLVKSQIEEKYPDITPLEYGQLIQEICEKLDY